MSRPMPLDPLAGRLARLLAEGSVAATALSARQRERLGALFAAGVLGEVRSGAGRRVEVRDRGALAAFSRALYPSGLEGLSGESAAPRSRAVAQVRDAKRAAGTDAEAVLLRGFGEAKITGPAGALEVGEWTRRAGVAALRVAQSCPWGWEGEMAVVENAEVFLHLEALGLSCGLALYAGGRLSRRVLAWLASPPMGGARYLHLGDYDPVGLDEYLRLARACPGRVRLFVPEGFEGLLAAYGKPALLAASPAVQARLRRAEDPEVRRVVALLDRHGAGLEQEALLIPTSGPGASARSGTPRAPTICG
ncbi:MAG: hypothetical protein AB1578_01740 [Thermodesulfobacteriota bacterium]